MKRNNNRRRWFLIFVPLTFFLLFVVDDIVVFATVTQQREDDQHIHKKNINTNNNSNSNSNTRGEKCQGLKADRSRLSSLSIYDESYIRDGYSFGEEGMQGGEQRERFYSPRNAATIMEYPRNIERESDRNPDNNNISNRFSNHVDAVCSLHRLRLEEQIRGIPIHGSEAILTYETCGNSIYIPIEQQQQQQQQHYDIIGPPRITNIRGKVTNSDFSVIPPPYYTEGGGDWFVPSTTEEQLQRHIPFLFGYDADIVGDVQMKVFVSEKGDYLAYFVTVINGVVRTNNNDNSKNDYHYDENNGNNSNSNYYNIHDNEETNEIYTAIIDAHTLELLSKCSMIDFFASDGTNENNDKKQRRRQQLRKQTANNNLTHGTTSRSNVVVNNDIPFVSEATHRGDMCPLCPTSDHEVVWNDENDNITTIVECNVNTYYLNNTGKKTSCRQGVDSAGSIVYGPARNDSLYWATVCDCESTANMCYCDMAFRDCTKTSNGLVGDSNISVTRMPGRGDATYDVYYTGLKTMEYLQTHLGLRGGLALTADNPQELWAFTHNKMNYCNAYFIANTPPRNDIVFGDCTCSRWGPMVPIDIIAHEIGHGVTSHSSNLDYSGQSGGLDEGFSDIMGAVLEFLINDSVDIPDFIVGDMIGNPPIRFMEHPTRDYLSIDHICDYTTDEEMGVHASSGILNKAYVAAVRECESSPCSTNDYISDDLLRECSIWLGTLFMYSNIHGLTTFSGFLDAAVATCELIDEFILARDLNYLITCTKQDFQRFIAIGWETVGIRMDGICTPEVPMGCLDDLNDNDTQPTEEQHEQPTDQHDNDDSNDSIVDINNSSSCAWYRIRCWLQDILSFFFDKKE